ncbi:MAG: hypothetical protein GX038_02150 [Erysipelothrix sp.]|nr:hypothetical protein [Erysipelothrix sp.]
MFSTALTISMMTMVAFMMSSLYKTFAKQETRGYHYNVSMTNVRNLPKLLDTLRREDIGFYTVYGGITPIYHNDAINVYPTTYPKYTEEADNEWVSAGQIVEVEHQRMNMKLQYLLMLPIPSEIR